MVALATLAVVGATALLGLLGLQSAAPASAATDCVAVLVDFRRLGGEVRTGCAQGDPGNGLQALAKAGFSYTPRPRDGLICQVDGTPACADTTSSTYWSYWYRSPGSSTWVYANQGAGTHDPRPGSTEAWVWQDGGRKQPPALAASSICPQLKTSPRPTSAAPQPTKATATRKSTAPSSEPGRTTSARHPSAKPKPTPATATRVPSASPSATRSSEPAGSATASTTAPALGDVDDDFGGAISGSVGLALGGVLVAGLGTAAALRARKNHSGARRNHSS